MKYSVIRNFWKDIANKHKQINSFLFGEPERLLGSNRSNINYPLLMLEPPNSAFDGQIDTPMKDYNIDFSVLVKAASGDFDAENEAWDLSEEIITDIISFLRNGNIEKTTTYDTSNIKVEVFSRYTADNLFGFHCQIILNTCIDLTYNPDKWTI